MKLSFILALLVACGDPGGDSPETECTTAFFLDGDGDGHGDPTVWATACSAPSGYSDTSDDCDDTNAVVHPGADEICDDSDDDCDGSIDVDAVDASVWFVDRDSDGYGDDAGTSTQCDRPQGHVDIGGDCDDYDRTVSPEGVEVCDGIDDDCDELVDSLDDSLADGTIWYVDADGDYFGDPTNPVSACEHPVGTVDDDHDCDDADPTVNPIADEACDTIDNDCDGLTDDEETEPVVGEIRYYIDSDGDGLGVHSVAPAPQDLCVAPKGWVTNADDCDDDDASVLGEIPWYWDDDEDGYGGDLYSSTSLHCTAPYSRMSAVGGDCNDSADEIYPTAPEICDDALDNNCDGTVDGDDPLVVLPIWYRDDDDDDYGDDTDTLASCDQPAGFAPRGGDCDDADSYVNPFAPEYCDSLDNDCDGSVDESVLYADWYADADGDGYGLDDDVVHDCVAPSGYGPLPGDCDDTVATTSPGEIETCDNGADDDCDGVVDNCAIPTDEAEFVVTGTDDTRYTFGMGHTMAAPDLNADGVADLVVALPSFYGSGASILYGPVSGAMWVEESVMLSDSGPNAYEVGMSLAAGDTDGDGADDVILGAGNIYDDAVYLFLGPVTADRTSADARFDNNSFQRLGWNVELVSDADGDGAPDLVMGAPEAANLTGTADCGIVYVTPAAATGDVDIRDATYLFGTGTTGRLGDAISNDFDANGDGISDLAMSAPDAGAGAIYIVEGGERAGVYTASSVAVTTITPDPMGGQFDGLDLVATDYDADGNADLIVGAPVPANGQVYLLLGPMTSSVSVEDAETTWVADTLDAILGAAVAVADLDGDGQLDVLMGATGQDATGVAYFQLGKASGTINAADLPKFAGPTDDEYSGLGDGLAVIPDWTGDGKPEVAISAPGWDDVGREGRVYGFLSETIF